MILQSWPCGGPIILQTDTKPSTKRKWLLATLYVSSLLAFLVGFVGIGIYGLANLKTGRSVEQTVAKTVADSTQGALESARDTLPK